MKDLDNSIMKKYNHVVWKYYLKPWANTKGIIIYKKDGRIREGNINKIGGENYFYKLKPLSVDELKFIEKAYCNGDSPTIQEVNKEWLSIFSWVNMLLSLREKIDNKDIQDDLDRLSKEFNENIHNKIENASQIYLDSLYKKDVSFYETDNGNNGFNFFVCEQYFRTSDMKKRIAKSYIPIKNFNFENCWNIISHILAINLAGTLSIFKNHFSCILLENNTETPFYTSDQPVINIAANKINERPLTMREFELFYPITPNIAILICLKENLIGIKSNIIMLDETQVKKYNAIITSQGGSTIYSNTKKGLL
jgi:hypothetical protein